MVPELNRGRAGFVGAKVREVVEPRGFEPLTSAVRLRTQTITLAPTA